MASLPITNLHRVVDTTLIAADAEGGYTYTYILMPATIWGHADHALTRAGIANYRSIQMPNVIAGSLLRGRPGVWGKGAGIWTSVEIGELGDLYMLLVDAVLRDPASIPHGREGYYFGATEEHSWYEASRAIGEAMVALGKTDNPEPTSFTDEEIAKWYKVSVPFVVLRGWMLKTARRDTICARTGGLGRHMLPLLGGSQSKRRLSSWRVCSVKWRGVSRSRSL